MIHEPEALEQFRSGALLVRRPQTSSERDIDAYLKLPTLITRTASKQAYYTIRVLADRDRRLAAYRAYAYFRWVDDWLDQPASERPDRLGFVARQQDLVARAYRGQLWSGRSWT
jgi:hypothetical protein